MSLDTGAVAELRERVRSLESENARLAEGPGPLKQEPYDDNEVLRQKEKVIRNQSECLDKSYRDVQKMMQKNERLEQDNASLRQELDSIKHCKGDTDRLNDALLHQVSELDAQIKALETRERHLAAQVKSSRRQYTPSTFLADSRRANDAKQPIADELKPYERRGGGDIQLSKVHKSLCNHPVLAFGVDEIIWPKKPADPISRAVVIRPTHMGQDAGVDKNYEFFCHSADKWWMYMGTFRCCAVATTNVPALLQDQVAPVDAAQLSEVMAERIVQKNTVPPMIFNNLRKMFRDGALQVCCMELKCVGFNHGLYDSLHNAPTAQLPNKATEPQGADSGAANQAGKGKRKAPAGHMPQGGTGGPPQKKPKKGPK